MNNKRLFLLILAVCTLLYISPANATKFYIDPINGSIFNDGSYASPWSTLEAVFDYELIETQSWSPVPYEHGVSRLVPKNEGAPIQAGDTLVLRSGLHGRIFIRGAVNKADIVIMAEEGHMPVLADIQLSAAMHWQLINLTFDASAYQYATNGTFIFVEDHGWHGPSGHIQVRGCTLRSALDVKEWTKEEWNERMVSGILIEGNHSIVEHNTMLNVNFGISISGDTSQVYANQIINFAGDGIRPQGSYINIESNVIKNCYDVNGNHDDGIQSFNLYGGRFEYNTIRRNTIINYEDENQPFRGTLQGIGCFDGPYHNWTIENNLIVVDHWHGISLYGAYDCKIINNTVIDPTPNNTPGPSWILVTDHKDGTPSAGCTVYNNLAGQINVDAIESNNFEIRSIGDYETFFRDYAARDFRLLPSSPAIDAGLDSLAPATDILGVLRPQGLHVDVGAYEFIDSSMVTNKHLEIVPPLILFPNPVQNQLFVSGKLMPPLAIYDMTGRLHLRINDVTENQRVLSIQTSGFMPGIFILKTRDDKSYPFLKL